MIKRECLERIGGFNERLFFGIDWEFMLRLLKYYKYKFLNKPVYKAHYEDPTNISHITKNARKNLLHRLKTYKYILTHYYSEIIKSKSLMSKHYFRIAECFYALQRYKLSDKYFRLAFQNNPRNLRYYLYYLTSKFKNTLRNVQKTTLLLFQKIEDRLYRVFGYYFYLNR